MVTFDEFNPEFETALLETYKQSQNKYKTKVYYQGFLVQILESSFSNEYNGNWDVEVIFYIGDRYFKAFFINDSYEMENVSLDNYFEVKPVEKTIIEWVNL